MKGIILAGGAGTRLYPLTRAVSKQLLPVYDKPMIYYPLSTLMLAGIREILVISTPQDMPRFRRLLGDGARVGPRASTTPCSRSPEGLAQAFIIGREFVGGDPRRARARRQHLLRPRPARAAAGAPRARRAGATVFAYHVRGPRALRRGRVRRATGRALGIEEKPRAAAVELRRHRPLLLRRPASSRSPRDLKPSARGELEITDVNRAYLERGELAGRAARPRLSPGSTPARTSRCSRRAVHRDDRAAPGPEGRLPRGDRLPHGLHRRPTSCARRPRRCAKNEYGQYLLRPAGARLGRSGADARPYREAGHEARCEVERLRSFPDRRAFSAGLPFSSELTRETR